MRDAEATKERILSAALTEFAAFGISGSRVARIAQSAGCNKNLIYVYFQDKETLFAVVLKKNLAHVYETIAPTAEDLPAYALRIFDFACLNPKLMRLMAWFSLEQKVDSPPERLHMFELKTSLLQSAQEAGQLRRSFPPAFLITSIMAIATSCTAVTTGESSNEFYFGNAQLFRKSVATAVRLLSQPG